jgi:uncharacterized lipoprotein YddW (UPF0748 family)
MLSPQVVRACSGKSGFSIAGFCSLGLVFVLLASASTAAEYRAFWVDGWGAGFLSQSQVDTLLGVPGTPTQGQIRDANCNAVIVQVRRRFDVCYPSGVGEPYMSSLSPANFNALAAMIKAAHDTTGGKKRIEVHCWSVAFKTSKGAVYSQHSDAGNPDNYWPTRIDSTAGAENSDGAFDPGHPKVLQYLVNAHMDLVNFQTTAGPDGTDGHIDGIHYDYIRFEANNEGFNPTSVARYKARFGLTPDPVATDEQFKQWRRDQVTAFVRQMYARIQKTKPWVRQSGSFVTWNPSPMTSTRAGFQATRPYYDVYSDWDSWMQEGIVDMAVPMTYYNWASLPNDYTRWMNFEKDRHGNRHMIIGPGTYLNSLANAILELQMTREPSPAGNRAHGFSGYSYRVPYASGTWAGFSPSLVSQVTPAWEDIPAMPWKTSPTNGHLMGVVTEAGTGAWADHALVNLTGPVHRSQSVDGTGFYAFIDLPPGSYAVTASKAGFVNATGSVAIAIGVVTGNMFEQNLALTPNAAPAISVQPQDQTAVAGANVTFAVSASGSSPLAYQWQFGGTNVTSATTAQLALTNVQARHAGGYRVVVTNTFGSVTSRTALLTVNPPFAGGGLRRLWSLGPGSRSYLTTNSLPNERGLACNPLNHHLILVNRTSPSIHVLDSATGADLGTLDKSGVSGGTYPLLIVGVADDGAVYAGNLTSAGNTTPFKLYRWANDSAATVPAVAYAGDPGAGNSQRWGDTLDVRGAGTNTQVILASRNANLVAILTTANGSTFASKLITVSDAPAGAFGLGLAFGANNTFWGKATSQSLRQVAFDLVAGTGSTLRNHASPAFPNTVAPLGVSTALNLLGGINVGATDNHFRLYDLTPTNGTPVFLASTNFASDNSNTGTGTGAVDFDGDRVFALGANNGLIAMQILAAAVPPTIETPPQSQSVKWSSNATFTVLASGTEPLSYQWWFNNEPLAGATQNSYTRFNAQGKDAGDYAVTATNVAGSATSAPAHLLIVLPLPAHFESIHPLPDGRMQVRWTGEPGWSYTLQTATHPDFSEWTSSGQITGSNGWFGFVDDDATNTAQRFYRTAQ